MVSGLIIMVLSRLLLALGFAYLIWLFAAKESPVLKTLGQTIAIAIVVVAVLAAVAPGRAPHRFDRRPGKAKLQIERFQPPAPIVGESEDK